MDTSTLKPANENPWYLMMTLYGEQEGDEIDWDLAERNRAIWSSWIVRGIVSDGYAEYLKRVSAPNAFGALTNGAPDALLRLFEERAGPDSLLKPPKWYETIDLRNTHFDCSLVLPRSLFGAVLVEGARFDELVFLRGSEFLDDIDFSKTWFGSELDFGEGTFTGRMRMQHATVSGKARLDSCNFGSGAVISSSRFMGETSFNGSIFEEEVSFLESSFEKKVDFVMSRFEGRAHFDGAVFGIKEAGHTDPADFSFATFAGPTSFEFARFVSQFPLLTGTTLNETTTITPELENWPRPRWSYGRMAARDMGRTASFHFRVKSSAAKLRHAMSRQSLAEEEHFFFRREMHHAARSEPFLQSAHIYLFEAISDFGYSIARPANLLLGMWLLGAFIFFEFASFGAFEALGYSFANMFKFFGLHRTYFDFEIIRAWPGWLQWFSGAQTVLGFILLFFLGLGLRTRFRLR